MKFKFFSIIAAVIIQVFSACSDDDSGSRGNGGGNSNLTDNEFTNYWIQDVMTRVYLWNEELPTSPNYKLGSEDFFYSILYNYGDTQGDRFSWIEEDMSKQKKALYADVSLGFDYIPMSYFPSEKETQSSIGLFVISVTEGSEAQTKGVKRGQVIYQVNGIAVNYNNYSSILSGVSSCTLGVYNNRGVKEILETFNATTSKPSPVFISKVITSSGVKIGYLMYNAFERNANDVEDNYEYDIELIKSIENLRNQGITEFVLDLRYNLGGYLTSAMDLASALVPNRNTKNIFAKEKYNDYYTDSLEVKYGKDAFNEYFLDKVYDTDVSIPQLNLSRLYVIATDYTASASELVIHGLRPYMPVYHVGQTTVGKDKGSQTITSDNNRISWQLQPLISRITDVNGVGNYINGLSPNYEVSEWEEGYQLVEAYYEDDAGNTIMVELPVLSVWKGGFGELGNPSEPLLAEAIAQITGVARRKSFQITAPANWTVKRVPFVKPDKKKAITLIDK